MKYFLLVVLISGCSIMFGERSGQLQTQAETSYALDCEVRPQTKDCASSLRVNFLTGE